jgi:DNA-binding transcriptional LysR family regulator
MFRMETIPIHLLNAFVAFNESKNIVEAAMKLQITQPALSKQLKALEARLPTRVFTVSGRKKSLTPFGLDLHRRLKERIGNIQELVQETWNLHANSSHAKIKISGRRGILDRISGEIKFSGSIYFEELSNEKIIKSLLALDCEIGVVHSSPNTHELVVKPLFKEEFRLVVPKALLPKRQVFGEKLFVELQSLPCLAYRPNDEILKSVCAFNSIEVSDLKMVRATENYQSLAEMVDVKMGWAVLPTYIDISENKNWLIPLPEDACSARQFYIAYRPEFSSVKWFKELIVEIRSCFAKETT